jgi:hypothetical protein
MNPVLRNTLLFGLAALLVLGLVWRMGAAEDRKVADPLASPKVTVVATDGAHLIAVDNTTQTLYYYAIERDGKIGDELKLRGTVDLKDVGKPSLKPVSAK